MRVEQVARLTRIDPWFLRHIDEIIAEERALAASKALAPERLRALKQQGFADLRLAALVGTTEDAVRAQREAAGIEPVYKTVDTCGAEFEAHTPYLYSTYEEGDDEAKVEHRKQKIVILGGGPNRIGQGIEFDYCCVHAALALREDGFETIMVNCNPETVSTDYDTSDKLYFEPLTLEDTLALIRREEPDGVVVQFGGQTPLRLAVPLERAGVPIIGTAPDSIDRAEDRERFEEVLAKLDLKRPPNGVARSAEEAVRVAAAIGYPILVRPSYVLGGRAMEIVYDRESPARYLQLAGLAAQGCTREIVPAHVNVKEAVFPFIKFPGVDTVLGPEMKSTGEVMGIDGSFGAAFAKAQIAASTALPTGGQAFISVPQADYEGVVPVARRLSRAGFSLLATRGTGAHLRAAGLVVEVVNKVSEGGPRILAALREGSAREQEQLLRRAHALLPTLREAAAAPPPWSEYRPSPAPVGTALAALAQPAQAVRGIGPQRAAELARFGLATVEDLLYHLPFRYEDRRALRPLGQLHVGEEATAVGEVARVGEGRAGRRGRRVVAVVLRDGDGLLVLVWFHQIPYFSRRLREGQRPIVHGRVEPPLGRGPKRIIP